MVLGKKRQQHWSVFQMERNVTDVQYDGSQRGEILRLFKIVRETTVLHSWEKKKKI